MTTRYTFDELVQDNVRLEARCLELEQVIVYGSKRNEELLEKLHDSRGVVRTSEAYITELEQRVQAAEARTIELEKRVAELERALDKAGIDA